MTCNHKWKWHKSFRVSNLLKQSRLKKLMQNSVLIFHKNETLWVNVHYIFDELVITSMFVVFMITHVFTIYKCCTLLNPFKCMSSKYDQWWYLATLQSEHMYFPKHDNVLPFLKSTGIIPTLLHVISMDIVTLCVAIIIMIIVIYNCNQLSK